MKNIKVCVENLSKIASTQMSVSCVDKGDAELTALALVQSGTFEKEVAEMGDVIHLDNKIFLVEAGQTVTKIEQDEYAYFKNIEAKDRVSQWFEGSLN